MEKIIFVSIVLVALCGCASQQKMSLEQVKQKVQQMKTDVQTVEIAYRQQGYETEADRMLGYENQLDKLYAILSTDLPENQCEAVQKGFRLAIQELIDSKEKPEYVLLAVMFKNMVEGYVCEGGGK